MIEHVIFDFDLTLVDSAEGICATLNALAAEKNLRSLGLDEVRRTIGLPLAGALRIFWGDGPVEEEWLPRYRQLFEKYGHEAIAPFPEVPPALDALRKRGYKMAVASNRLAPLAIVAATGLEKYFSVIVGTEGLAPKPDPAVVIEAMRQLGARPENTAYVGDTDIDMKTACSACVAGIGAATGNHDAAALAAAGARRVIHNLGELPECLEAM
ncbi:MAG: HAD family hydrolase [Pyramidobacter sp.]|nr:HAD family hydrolase [Pyramidobacter sp.]